MTQNGWRKPTPGLLQAKRFAEVGEEVAIGKTRAMVAVKKVAAVIGLKAQDVLLLDLFGAVSQPQDWQTGRRPIVWPSNQFLMQQTGFALTTLRRHLRRLCELGVLAMSDSPNGKRWGRRGPDGVIVEAYGFDLSPLAARTAEFEALYAGLQAERTHCARLRRQITIARREIRAKIDAASEHGLTGLWDKFQTDLMDHLASIWAVKRAGDLEKLLAQLDALNSQIEHAFKHPGETIDQAKQLIKNVNAPKMTPKGVENGTHIQTTHDHYPVVEEDTEMRKQGMGGQDRRHLERRTGKKAGKLAVRTVTASCSHFTDMAQAIGQPLDNWQNLHHAADALRPMLGITRQSWGIAQNAMGPDQATAALALILDKTAEGAIASPTGYLQGLTRRAEAGALHLERSLHGRLARAREAVS
ncbi:MAG: plasmid replication protein RepC [Pseudomonadota bacterium]